jgi:hypothetical protein
MTIGEKLKNLVNPMKWAQGFLINKFAKRIAQFGAAAVVTILSNQHLAEALASYGVSSKFNVDQKVLADAISVGIVALMGAIFNMAKHGPLKTVNDDPKGPPAPAE